VIAVELVLADVSGVLVTQEHARSLAARLGLGAVVQILAPHFVPIVLYQVFEVVPRFLL